MHLDIFRDIPKHERLERLDPLVQKFSLEFHNAFGNLVNRPLPLVNTSDQPEGGSKLVLDIFSVPFQSETAAVEDVPVKRIDLESRNPVIVQIDDIISLHLVNIDAGNDPLWITSPPKALPGLGSNLEMREAARFTRSKDTPKRLAMAG